MVLDLIKAFIIGMCVSVPIGPVSISVLRNTFAKGRRSGFVTGLGATTVDSVWATVSIFALGYAQRLFDSHQTVILMGGGILLIGLGVAMAMSNPFRQLERQNQKVRQVSATDYLKSVAMGFSNPGAIFIMFGIMAAFKLGVSQENRLDVLAVIVSLAAGSIFYWFCITGIFSRLKRSVNVKAILWVSRMCGVAIAIFGAYFLTRSLLIFFNCSYPL